MAILIVAAALVLGLLVGSFLNVVIYRYPIMLKNGWRAECEEFLADSDGSDTPPRESKPKEVFNLAQPRSHCPSCKTMVPAWCNIPLVSYLILKGKCYKCKTSISLRYPIIELLCGVLTAFIVYRFGLSVQAGFLILFTWTLVSLSFIDVDHQLLPDDLTLPLLWAGIIINSQGIFTDLQSSVFGAAFGYLTLWSVYWLFKLSTGKDGMGYGDFKLLAALGAWMGWQDLPTIILMSAFSGAVIGSIAILLSGKGKNTKIPFGPYLAVAGWLTFIWGDQLQSFYFSLIGV